jgi:hypothetical protein
MSVGASLDAEALLDSRLEKRRECALPHLFLRVVGTCHLASVVVVDMFGLRRFLVET